MTTAAHPRAPRWLLRAALSLCVCALAAAPARADEEERERLFRVFIRGDLYVASLDLSRLFDAGVKQKIKSGLTTRVVVRTQVIDVDASVVRALTLSEFRVLYRVWEEDYVVRHWTTLGERSFKLRRYAEVLRRIAHQRHLPLAARPDLPQGGRYQAVVVVEIDPVSDELLEKVREYLANPGGHRAEGGGRGLFGNLARIFFDPRAGTSSTSLTLRSHLFGAALPEPGKP